MKRCIHRTTRWTLKWHFCLHPILGNQISKYYKGQRLRCLVVGRCLWGRVVLVTGSIETMVHEKTEYLALGSYQLNNQLPLLMMSHTEVGGARSVFCVLWIPFRHHCPQKHFSRTQCFHGYRILQPFLVLRRQYIPTRKNSASNVAATESSLLST